MIVAALAIATACPPAMEAMTRTVEAFDGVTVVDATAETPTRRVHAAYAYEAGDRLLECDGVLTVENRRTTRARIRYRHLVRVPDGWKPKQGQDETTGVCGDRDRVVLLIESTLDAGNTRETPIRWTVPLFLRADIDEDGRVDSRDQGMEFADWGTNAWRSDLNGDGRVDGRDLGMVQEAWTP